MGAPRLRSQPQAYCRIDAGRSRREVLCHSIGPPTTGLMSMRTME